MDREACLQKLRASVGFVDRNGVSLLAGTREFDEGLRAAEKLDDAELRDLVAATDAQDADYYGYFMTALFGLIDDAELSGYDQDAVEHLRRARELFWAEFRQRHPVHQPTASPLPKGFTDP